MVPAGACLEAKNYFSVEGGLRRRPGTGVFCASSAPYTPWQDLLTFWKTTGAQEFLGLDNKFLYSMAGTGYTGIYWEYTAAVNVTVTLGSTAVTAAAGTGWVVAANEFQPGDVLVYGASYQYQNEVSSFDSDTGLTLKLPAVGDLPGTTFWKIRRAWRASNPYYVDFAVITGSAPAVLFADGGRFLYSYNGTTLTDYNPAEALIPNTVAFHKNRVWVGNYLQSSIQHRQGIAWTELGDLDDFTNGGYLDLPYVRGAIKRLVPMGDFLVAFLDDAIYIGRPTNMPTLPLMFQKVETGGVGLVGMKAVVPYLDGLFFVGQNDIYYLSSRGIEPVGSPVVKRTLRTVSGNKMWRIFGVHDLINNRVLFGFPKSGNEIEELWSYNYKTKGWGYDALNCYMVSTHIPDSNVTWQTWVTAPYTTGTVTTNGTTSVTGAGTTWAAGHVGDYMHIDIDGDGNYKFTSIVSVVGGVGSITLQDAAPAGGPGLHYRLVDPAATWGGSEMTAYPNWEVIGDVGPIPLMYVMKGDVIDVYAYDGANDKGSPITAELITGDRDFDLPDDEKTYYRLAVKLEDQTSSDLVFDVAASNDKGQHWKNLGVLRILANKDEGHVDFRVRGSGVRFKLTGTNDVAPYTINEITMMVRVTGTEVPGRGDPV